MKMKDGATRRERFRMANTLLAVVDDSNLILFDTKSFVEDMQERMVLVDIFNGITSAICFILGAFQLIMTLSANIKDSMWELGVLRSMGTTRSQITRVMVHEMVSNTISAMILGYSSGILISLLSIAQFHIIVELPISIELPLTTMAIVGVSALVSLFFGAKYGTSILYQKNIASILKGQ